METEGMNEGANTNGSIVVQVAALKTSGCYLLDCSQFGIELSSHI